MAQPGMVVLVIPDEAPGMSGAMRVIPLETSYRHDPDQCQGENSPDKCELHVELRKRQEVLSI